MDRTTLGLTILGMMAVTYLPRLLPLWLLASRSLPRPVVVWLRYVPVAVLAAMLAPALTLQEGQLDIGLGNLFLLASVPTFLVAWRRRSLFGAVIVGMAVIALARLLLRM